jgi:hypothetical protein
LNQSINPVSKLKLESLTVREAKFGSQARLDPELGSRATMPNFAPVWLFDASQALSIISGTQQYKPMLVDQ